MKATAGAIVYETLKSHGVRCIFGMEDPIHIFHAVDRAFTKIVTIRDEKHGAIMAHGYAQATGRPGVCASTFGPGATNLITGLLEAQRSSVPVIALVQDQPLLVKGKNASSELDHQNALAPFVKATLRINAPSQAGDVVRSAFRLACTGRPGPVAVLCPTDVLATETEADTGAPPAYCQFPAHRVRPADEEIAVASRLLSAAERPLLIAGGGCVVSGAFDEVRALAERFSAPVATTLTGRGAIADSHPLAVGPLGTQTGGYLGRSRIGNTLFAEADLVFIMGSRTGQLCYSNWQLPRPGTKIIHLDIDPQEIGRNFSVDAALVGDIRDTLRDLLHQCDRDGLRRLDRTNGGRIAELREEFETRNAPYLRSDAKPIRPERVIAEINKVVDAKTLVVADASYSTSWALSHLDVPVAHRFVLSPRGTGSIGWGFPAAVGAKLGDPSRTVISLGGDGGFGYVMNELETAARYGVHVVVVVLNNATLGYQRHWEEKAMGRYMECDFLQVDYAGVAKALGCQSERVADPKDLAAALGRGLAARGPYLVDVIVDPKVNGPVTGMDREEALLGSSH